jgi:hypothetical protein
MTAGVKGFADFGPTTAAEPLIGLARLLPLI